MIRQLKLLRHLWAYFIWSLWTRFMRVRGQVCAWSHGGIGGGRAWYQDILNLDQDHTKVSINFNVLIGNKNLPCLLKVDELAEEGILWTCRWTLYFIIIIFLCCWYNTILVAQSHDFFKIHVSPSLIFSLNSLFCGYTFCPSSLFFFFMGTIQHQLLTFVFKR